MVELVIVKQLLTIIDAPGSRVRAEEETEKFPSNMTVALASKRTLVLEMVESPSLTVVVAFPWMMRLE